MDEHHIEKMIEVMLACHGDDAENAARKRANRCMRRKEPEWAALWREVADRIARDRRAGAVSVAERGVAEHNTEEENAESAPSSR